MQTVLDCLNSYRRMKKDYDFILKSGVKFSLHFTYDQFYHMIGLQYLSGDTKLHVKGKTKISVLKAIESGKISQQQLEADPGYMFNPRAVPGFTQIKAEYLLCQKIEVEKLSQSSGDGHLYLFLGINEDGYTAYPCTYFLGPGSRFIKNQKWDEIESIN